MTIFAVDDEELALGLLVRTIEEVVPDATIRAFSNPLELIECASQHHCDVAFLDVSMRELNGLEAAKRLKETSPTTNIVFVTGYSEYMASAFALHASGYLLKPVTSQDVKAELDNLRHPVEVEAGEPKIFVQTFGNFEVFIGGKPLIFSRSKSKELLAYLVDRQGAAIKSTEAAAILWEDKEYDRSLQKQTQNIILAMIQTLKEAGAGDLIIKSWNSLSVDRTKFECDYYDLLNWDAKAVNSYCGEYMSNYSWAEMRTEALNKKVSKLP